MSVEIPDNFPAPKTYEPGIYHGISFAEYCKIDAVNASSLKYMEQSPAHFLAAKANPWEGSDSTDLGRALHTLVLEPELYTDSYFTMPEFEPIKAPTKTGGEKTVKTKKAQEEEHAARFPGKEALSVANTKKIFEMAENIAEHGDASRYLKNTKREATVVFDTKYGLCKARVDAYDDSDPEGIWIYDIKTTKSASIREFSKDIIRFKYYLSLAFYKYALESVGKRVQGAKLILVENEAPHAVRVINISIPYLNAGIVEALHYLKTLHDCRQADYFPGYPEEEITLEPPEWLEERVFNLIDGK